MKTQTRKSQKQADRDEAIARLRSYLSPGDTVYCILRHVSRSGMQRRIDLYSIKNGQPFWLSGLAAKALGYRLSDEQGLVVGGCGMDMGFHLVYSLGRVLFPDGFCPSSIGIRPSDGRRVQTNIGRGKGAGPMTREEMAKMHAEGWQFEAGRNGDKSGWDNDGGYALKHSWL